MSGGLQKASRGVQAVQHVFQPGCAGVLGKRIAGADLVGRGLRQSGNHGEHEQESRQGAPQAKKVTYKARVQSAHGEGIGFPEIVTQYFSWN